MGHIATVIFDVQATEDNLELVFELSVGVHLNSPMTLPDGRQTKVLKTLYPLHFLPTDTVNTINTKLEYASLRACSELIEGSVLTNPDSPSMTVTSTYGTYTKNSIHSQKLT